MNDEAARHSSIAAGKEARRRLPRNELAAFEPADDLRDPVGILADDDEGRVHELIPIRYGRMLTSPFAFYRGAASLMAQDLGPNQHTGIFTQICGDAHISNFGLFAAPDRRLVFDINDFDETLPGPWEWDLKRMAASVAIAAEENGAGEAAQRKATMRAVAGYREQINKFAEQTNLDVFYARLEVDKAKEVLAKTNDKVTLKKLDKAAQKALTRDSLREFNKLTEVVDGRRRIISAPPLITPVEDVIADVHHGKLSPEEVQERLAMMVESYKSRLLPDRKHLLDQYAVVHMARKVVGVGSVGTRVWIVLLIGRDSGDPLFLQVKEAGRSVYERYLGPSEHEYAGQRVIAGQRLMQAASDPLIGWENVVGLDGIGREFYVRQLKDWKGSAKIEKLSESGLGLYSEICGRILARAHARAGDRHAIAAYVGKSDKLDGALADFALSYAAQNQRDYARLMQAADDGVVPVETGL